jgi:dCMP deaminase
MEVARTIAKRATCDRDRNGCVIAKNNRLLVTWYVGSPMWMPYCDDVWHQFNQLTRENWDVTNHCMRTVHAEQNAICQAARSGISLEWSTLYCKITPCRTCAMLIMSCWIKTIICEKKVNSESESEAMFNQVGIELKYFDDKDRC